MNRTVNVFNLAAGVAESFGLAATAPFTALMSGIILTRKKIQVKFSIKKNKKIKPRNLFKIDLSTLHNVFR